MAEVVRRLRAVTGAPLIAMPNAGMPELVGGETRFPESPEELASKVGRLAGAGASIIGGCCGTTPAHVAAMARALERENAQRSTLNAQRSK
jgi:5-methyltetrahydrofolate--homocysteine methyltransferase